MWILPPLNCHCTLRKMVAVLIIKYYFALGELIVLVVAQSFYFLFLLAKIALVFSALFGPSVRQRPAGTQVMGAWPVAAVLWKNTWPYFPWIELQQSRTRKVYVSKKCWLEGALIMNTMNSWAPLFAKLRLSHPQFCEKAQEELHPLEDLFCSRSSCWIFLHAQPAGAPAL